MKTILFILLVIGFAPVAVLALMIALGGPSDPPEMNSINAPFKGFDRSILPPLKQYSGRDGAALYYRAYPSKAPLRRGSVVLVHGSSANNDSMSFLALALSEAGFDAYALDMRGHGASVPKGKIGWIGQLEDDLEAFIEAVQPAQPRNLTGFSSGGGFVLRFAGSERQTLFQSYLLLSPFISQNAATYRPNSGGWVRVGLARTIGLSIINGFGITAGNDLPTTSFALDPTAKQVLTPTYSYALATNFRPQMDYRGNIDAVERPTAIIAGTADEAFFAAQFEGVVRGQNKDWPVKLVDGIDHIGLILKPEALSAAVDQVVAFSDQ